MNISRTFALALVGAVTMTGCVSIETLDQDLKSNDVKKQSAAVQNMSDIVTNGKVFPFSTFSSADRLWCAKHITDKDEIAKIVEMMSQMRRDPQAPQEVNDALMGMYSDVNAPIIEEYPLTLECMVRSWDPNTGYLIGEIVASQADESILTDGKVDLGKLKPIIFDPSFNVYRVIGETVGNAFKDGLQLK